MAGDFAGRIGARVPRSGDDKAATRCLTLAKYGRAAESASKWGCWVRGRSGYCETPNICVLHQRQGAAATRDHAARTRDLKVEEAAMPVRWQIDHATWTVVVTAEGTLGLIGFEELLDSMARVGTLSYRKLFDM